MGELEQEAEGDLPGHEERDRRQQGDRPAQERAGEDADGRQDHRLEPDAEEPLHEVGAEVARVRQDVQVALGHAQVLRRAEAADLDPQVAPRAGQDRGREVLACWCSTRGSGRRSRYDAPVLGLVATELGVDGLADLPLGRPVDVEGHLQRDRPRVQRGRLAAERVGLGRALRVLLGLARAFSALASWRRRASSSLNGRSSSRFRAMRSDSCLARSGETFGAFRSCSATAIRSWIS